MLIATSSSPEPGESAPPSFDDVDLRFDDLPSGQLGEAELGLNRHGDVVRWTIVLDAGNIRIKANQYGATTEQMFAYTILHEYMHFLYGSSESNADRKAQEWYEDIYGHPAPPSSRFDRGLHGTGSSNPVDPCGDE